MPRTLDFVLADVFTDRPFGGNPLAVFPRVRDLATEAMQAIAREPARMQGYWAQMSIRSMPRVACSRLSNIG
jgi:hypothetical protein